MKADRGAPAHGLSLKGLLLCLLLPGMLLSLAFDSYNDYQTLTDITRTAYDQALRQRVDILESNIEFDPSGEVRVVTPWYAGHLLESQPQETIYYQVRLLGGDPVADAEGAMHDSVTLQGHTALPLPDDWQAAATGIAFQDATFLGEPVRVAARLHRLNRDGAQAFVLVQVAQRSVDRMHAESLAWKQEWRRDLRAVVVVALLLWLGISWGLRPLARLRREVAARAPDDTTALDIRAVPVEVVPLVQAVNHHITRHRAMVDGQAAFLADASHQLRTPLAVMLTQAEYALRETDPEKIRESLRAMIQRMGTTRRLTEQLLNLAMAQHASDEGPQVFDLALCARQVLLEYLPLAEAKHIDLGWDESADQPESLHVTGHADGVREAIANLVHNAIRYIPVGGRITLSAGSRGGQSWIAVADNGPGIPPAGRDRVFERFVREAASADAEEGSAGLGLAIAREFVRRDGGRIEMHDGEPNAEGGAGLKAVLSLPEAAPA